MPLILRVFCVKSVGFPNFLQIFQKIIRNGLNNKTDRSLLCSAAFCLFIGKEEKPDYFAAFAASTRPFT